MRPNERDANASDAKQGGERVTDAPRPTVLVVEDDAEIANMYAEWLDSLYDVRTAYDGNEALSMLDDGVDVVLLDRLMPELSGDEVLDLIRERDLDCRIAMVTAVEPSFDIIEMGFDDYLVKPVYKTDLYHTVETLLTRASYTPSFQEFHALAEKQSVLESEKTEDELLGSDEYRTLASDVEALRTQLDDRCGKWTTETGFGSVFRRLSHRIRPERPPDDEE